MSKRRGPIVGLIVMAIAVISFLFVFVIKWETSEVVDGSWEVGRRGTLVGHGISDRRLYHRTRSGSRTCVDQVTENYRYYGDDCIVYESFRGPGHPNYYVACGNREPLLLAAEEDGKWEMNADGITHRSAPTVIEARSSNDDYRPIGPIKAAAQSQPPLGKGWCD